MFCSSRADTPTHTAALIHGANAKLEQPLANRLVLFQPFVFVGLQCSLLVWCKLPIIEIGK